MTPWASLTARRCCIPAAKTHSRTRVASKAWRFECNKRRHVYVREMESKRQTSCWHSSPNERQGWRALSRLFDRFQEATSKAGITSSIDHMQVCPLQPSHQTICQANRQRREIDQKLKSFSTKHRVGDVFSEASLRLTLFDSLSLRLPLNDDTTINQRSNERNDGGKNKLLWRDDHAISREGKGIIIGTPLRVRCRTRLWKNTALESQIRHFQVIEGGNGLKWWRLPYLLSYFRCVSGFSLSECRGKRWVVDTEYVKRQELESQNGLKFGSFPFAWPISSTSYCRNSQNSSRPSIVSLSRMSYRAS